MDPTRLAFLAFEQRIKALDRAHSLVLAARKDVILRLREMSHDYNFDEDVVRQLATEAADILEAAL